MIIDFHTHTFPEKIADRTIGMLSRKAHIEPFTDSTNGQLSESMERAGIDLSVILPVATASSQVEKLNTISAEMNGKTDRTGQFYLGSMHPDYENYREELERVRAMGLKGIKIHPVYQETDLDDIRYLRILDRAAELGLFAVTHAGLDVGYPGVVHCSPAMSRNVVETIGRFPFVLAHMGGWRNWDEVLTLLPDTGAYLDTAFSFGRMHPLPDGYWKEEELKMLDPEKAMELIRAFGPDRILFGTDSPWSDQKAELEFVRELPLSEAEKRSVLGENAAELLGI